MQREHAIRKGEEQAKSIEQRESQQQTAPRYSINFVCLGNICRSPAGEGIMAQMVAQSPWAGQVRIDSCGTYGGHAGELPDRRMRQAGAARGYHFDSRSRQVRPSDFDEFDLLLAMDDSVYHDLQRMAPTLEARQKVHRMAEFFPHSAADHVPDPYYGGAGGFEYVLDLLEEGCQHLLDRLPRLIRHP